MSIAARTSPRSRRKGTRLGASHLRQERSLVVSGEGVPLRAAVFDLVGAMCRPCAPLGWSDRGRGRERDRGEALSLCGVEVPTLLGRIVAETKRWGTGDCVGDAAAPAPAGPGRSERRSRRRRRWVATRRTSWTCHTPSGQRRCLGRTRAGRLQRVRTALSNRFASQPAGGGTTEWRNPQALYWHRRLTTIVDAACCLPADRGEFGHESDSDLRQLADEALRGARAVYSTHRVLQAWSAQSRAPRATALDPGVGRRSPRQSANRLVNRRPSRR